jgi:hypothetical protein
MWHIFKKIKELFLYHMTYFLFLRNKRIIFISRNIFPIFKK